MFWRNLNSDITVKGAVDVMTANVMIADDNLNIIYVNESVTAFLSAAESDIQKDLPDFRAADLIGRNIDTFYKNLRHQRQMLATLTSAQRATIDLGGRRFDLIATPLKTEKGKRAGTLVEWSDASHRIESLALAARSDAIGRAQCIIEFNPDGSIVTANENFLRATGYELSEIQGRHHSIFVIPAERDSRSYKDFWAALARGDHQSGEYRRVAKGGRDIWLVGSYNPVLDENGHVVRVIKLATDVTEQKMKTADLAGQIAAIGKSQAVIEFALDGTILTANDNFLNALGYSLSEIQGRHHSMFVDRAEIGTAAYTAFWANLNRGDYQAGEFRRIGKNGRDVWIQASYNPILDLNGKPFKVVKYAIDTTRQVLTRMGNERIRGMMESVASGAEELNSSVREISEAMVRSRERASEAVNCVATANGQARRLTDAAQAMSGIVDLINNITGQINLLALNATIESARAGEAGRGFAVVASEVKNLATQAKGATERISEEIGGLGAISGDVVEALAAIGRAIQHVNEYVTSTAAAVEEQSAVANDMSSSMQRAAAEAAAIASAT